MYRALITVALQALILIAMPAAWAHDPYTTEVMATTLPDGNRGQIRLIHGDGILFTDPVRAVLIDAEGKLLGRTTHSYSMSIICAEDGSCAVIDVALFGLIAMVSNPETWRLGGPSVPMRGETLWGIEHGKESWGFRTRPATPVEWTKAIFSHLADHLLAGALAFLLPMSATAMLYTLPRIKIGRTLTAAALSIALAGLVIGTAFTALATTTLVFFLSDLAFLVGVVLSGTGVLAAAAAALKLRAATRRLDKPAIS